MIAHVGEGVSGNGTEHHDMLTSHRNDDRILGMLHDNTDFEAKLHGEIILKTIEFCLKLRVSPYDNSSVLISLPYNSNTLQWGQNFPLQPLGWFWTGIPHYNWEIASLICSSTFFPNVEIIKSYVFDNAICPLNGDRIPP